MNIQKMLRSFRYAFKGVIYLIRTENNAKFHVLVTVFVIILGFWLNITPYEWISVTMAIGIVLASEAFNTAIEKICDFISPHHHQTIGTIKDLAAGGVLIASLAAVIIGFIIFLPKIFQLFTL